MYLPPQKRLYMVFTTILSIVIYIDIRNLQDPESSPDSSHEKSRVPVQNQWVPVQNPMSRYKKDARTLLKPDNHI